MATTKRSRKVRWAYASKADTRPIWLGLPEDEALHILLALTLQYEGNKCLNCQAKLTKRQDRFCSNQCSNEMHQVGKSGVRVLQKVLKAAQDMVKEFGDQARRVEEIVARERAHAYWDEPNTLVDRRMQSQKKEYDERLRKAKERIACMEARDMRKLLRKEKSDSLTQVERERLFEYKQRRAEMTRQLASVKVAEPVQSLVEPVNEGIVAHAEQPSSTGLAVGGAEGQNFEVIDGDGGGGGTTTRSTASPSSVVPSPALQHPGDVDAGTDGVQGS